MSMTAFTKEIWRAMGILVRIFREVGKSVTDVEFFINTKCRLKATPFPGLMCIIYILIN